MSLMGDLIRLFHPTYFPLINPRANKSSHNPFFQSPHVPYTPHMRTFFFFFFFFFGICQSSFFRVMIVRYGTVLLLRMLGASKNSR